MKVKAVQNFTGITPAGRMVVNIGDVFDLPDGVDWLAAGLVEKVKRVRRQATKTPAEKATGKGQK